MLGNELPDQAAKETAGSDPNAGVNNESPLQPDAPRTLMETTKSTARRAMKSEWQSAWDNSKQGRSSSDSGYGQEKQYSTHTSVHTEQSALELHRCVKARLAYGHISTPLTRPKSTRSVRPRTADGRARPTRMPELGRRTTSNAGRQASMH